MSKKSLTVKYLYCIFKFTISKIDHKGKNGKTLGFVKKIPPYELGVGSF